MRAGGGAALLLMTCTLFQQTESYSLYYIALHTICSAAHSIAFGKSDSNIGAARSLV